MWQPLQQQAGLWLAQVRVQVRQAAEGALRLPSAQAQLGAVPVEMVELAVAGQELRAVAGQELRAVEGQAAVVQLPQQAALQVRAK